MGTDTANTTETNLLSTEECKECDGDGYTYEGGMSMNEEMNVRVPCGSCDSQGYVDLDYLMKR